MTVIYVTHAIQVVAKKSGGYAIKHVIYDSFKDPSSAHQQACTVIVQILEKEDYFSEKPVPTSAGVPGTPGTSEHEKRMEKVKSILGNQDPSAGKHYDLDNLISKWSPTIPELKTKKYDIYVSESTLV
jgi:hypothetical protein